MNLNLLKIAFTLYCFLTLAGTVSAQIKMVDKDIEKKVSTLLGKMTLEEKIGQMNQYNGFWKVTGPAPSDEVNKLKYDQLRSGQVGSMLNVVGVENVRKIQEIAVKETRLGIPLIFGLDVIHGHKTLAPIPLAEAASWDMKAIENSARIAAIESSAMGINWTFAPMVDIYRDARWGRVMEGAGEDPYLGALVGVARINGFQGKDLASPSTIAACAKHFAAYGFAESGKEYNTVDIGTSTLYNIVLPPFKAAVDAGVATLMNSFNTLNGIPATGNKFLQRDILKKKWGFNGFVVSDWGSGAQMVKHGYAKDLAEAAQMSAIAGSDMDMESYAYIGYLKKLVEDGKVPMEVIDEAVTRILRVKYALGLMDNPYLYCDEAREKEKVGNKESFDAVRDIAKKSIVLLKNEASAGNLSPLLPLKTSQKNIAVIGALANDKNSPLGSWRLGSDDNTAVSVLEGLKNYGVPFTYSKGADVVKGTATFINEIEVNTKDKSGFAAAIALAKKSGTVIMVLGEHGFQTGEGRSRTEIGLPGVQQELLEEVYKVNKNIVLVLMNGRPLTIPWAAKNIPTIVEGWQLGTETGNALAEVLTGKYNPSGKLPMSFPRSVGQLPLYYNHYSTGRPDSVKEVFWSHYSDESNDPQYPFGFGLSYTNFSYSDLKIDQSNKKNITVTVVLKNVGKVDGEEVAQLYIHDVTASVARPVKELKGFKKLMLKAGQSETISFSLTEKELGFFDNDGNYIVEPGDFEIFVGGSSAQGLKTTFTL